MLTKELDHMPLTMTLLTLYACTSLQYDVNVNSLTKKQRDRPIDGPPFIMGLLTVFKQFTCFNKYLVYLSHYIKGAILYTSEKRSNALPQDVALLLAVLEEIIRFGKLERNIVKQVFGTNFLFDNFKLNQVNKTMKQSENPKEMKKKKK